MRLRALAVCALCLVSTATPARAQTSLPDPQSTATSLHLEGTFFGDNGEFFNPFRSGETILGANQRLFVEFVPGERARLRLGVYATERAGSSSPVDRALPIVSVRLGVDANYFVMGTLETGERAGAGLDRLTPHGLLPPLAAESLWFTRAYEAGIQWRMRLPRVTQDLWLDYQAMNTPDHREKFDAGVVTRVPIAGPVSLAGQFHVVHHGGQQYSTGPVADSVAYAIGAEWAGRWRGLSRAGAEIYVLGASDAPDRGRPALELDGAAVFMRLSGESRGWRGHVIAWRGSDFYHEDGDANYLSRTAAGEIYAGTRDYAEAGLSRTFHAAAGVDFEVGGRVHRIESEYAYSYRLLATVQLAPIRLR